MLTRLAIFAFALGLAMSAGPSAAQLPNLGGTIGGVLDNAPLPNVQDTTQTLSRSAIRELREARATANSLLLREQRQAVEADPNGFAVLRHEVVAIAPSEAALTLARTRGFAVTEIVEAEGLGLSMIVLRAPQGMSTREALELLRTLDPEGAYDFNHVYFGAGQARGAPAPAPQEGGGAASARVGLIDSGIDARHRAFAGASISQRSFVGGDPLAAPHGSAVASLILAAAPGAALYVADVYGARPGGGGASAIVSALSWMAQQRVGVINISLVGPPNRALEAGVRAAIARGHIVVAAVGNDGPNAPALYPAAYAGVIGVTGVDARDRALPEALRGEQVDFSAPGAGLHVGSANNVRGTSFAAPIVAGLLAQRLPAPSAQGATRAISGLESDARDLGSRGRDTVYGIGLVGQTTRNAGAARR